MTVLLYNGPLLCSFNVPVKGLIDLRLLFRSLCSQQIQVRARNLAFFEGERQTNVIVVTQSW